MFAPAALLPFWFALVQVGFVYAFAQVLVGVRRTVTVAVGAHALATGSAHLWVVIGYPLGVGHRYDWFGDAGPSVAVIALIAYVAVVYRVSWVAICLIIYHVVEISVFNGLSQREHLVGTLTGTAAGAATRLSIHRRPARQ
jgi:hypothetical protein